MKVYELNNIPCVYIYPDNLGILQYSFKMRLEEELKKYHKLKPELKKFKIWKYKKLLTQLIIIWLITILSLTTILNILSGRLEIEINIINTFLILTIAAIVFGYWYIVLKKHKSQH